MPSITANIACELAPLALEISTQARAALAAARSGDRDAMLRAAQAAGDLANQIVDAAVPEGPGASPEPMLVSILSTAYAGNQVSLFFRDVVPSAEDLTSFEGTILGTLDLSVADVETGAADCPVP
jgi:hypothetical protein